MYTYQQISERIEQIIDKYDYRSAAPELYSPVEYTLSQHGKRMRPILAALACNIFSDDIDDVWNAALAVEMFHNFTLLHDDIMDNAYVRRNMPTVHVKWGLSSAVLSGDAMLIESYHLLENLPEKVLPAVFKVFNRIAKGVCEGQQLDMEFEERDNVGLNEYINMIGLKTAVLIEGAMEIGALIGGASAEEAAKLASYGFSIGLSFQIQDDVLDLYGNSNSFGKVIGGDIIEGKKSYLLLAALEQGTPQQCSMIKTLIADDQITDEQKISRVKSIYDQLEVKQMAEAAVEEGFEAADEALFSTGIAAERLLELKKFVASLKNRTR